MTLQKNIIMKKSVSNLYVVIETIVSWHEIKYAVCILHFKLT
jgi:hypothetical protein